MRRAPLILAVLGALLALALFGVAVVQVAVVKFPTEWELAKVEQLLEGRTTLTAEQQKLLNRSLGWIKDNNSRLVTVHYRLHRIAMYGFLSLAVLFGLLAYVLWSQFRGASPTSVAASAGELKR